MTLRLVLGLLMTAAALALAARRVRWLSRLIRSGQPATGRTVNAGERLRAQLSEVFAQRRLLKWSLPGVAHLVTFWGFLILGTVYLEAYGTLFDEDFHIPLAGRWPALGFLQDLFAVGVLAAVVTFAVIRLWQAPARRQRASRSTARTWAARG